jgi:hypothetical protein
MQTLKFRSPPHQTTNQVITQSLSLQGYLEQVQITPSSDHKPSGAPDHSAPPPASLTVVSRRSKYRAGTRFKRRGIDHDGKLRFKFS